MTSRSGTQLDGRASSTTDPASIGGVLRLVSAKRCGLQNDAGAERNVVAVEQVGAGVIRILDPVGIVEDKQQSQVAVERVRRAGIRPELNGATLGVLTNLFRGYDVPGSVAARIKQRNAVADVVRHSKPSISRPAGEEAYDKLVAAGIDAALIGLGG
jgi:hypothetical protein